MPIPLDDIRPILESFVEGWVASSQQLMRQLASGNGAIAVASSVDLASVDLADFDLAEAIAAIETAAAEVVSKRSRSPIPEPMRRRRMSKREKEEAITFALLSLLHLVDAAAERAEGAAALDRMLGLDRRRKSIKPYLTTEDPLALARAADPERMRRGAKAADDELELARRFLRIGFELGHAYVALMVLDLGPSIAEMYTMMRAMPAQTIGPLVAFGVTSMAGGFHDHRAEINVEQMLQDLDSTKLATAIYEELEKLSERAAFRQALPPRVRREVEDLGREVRPARLSES